MAWWLREISDICAVPPGNWKGCSDLELIVSGDSCCLRLVCVLAHGTCAMEVQCRAHHKYRQHSECKFFSTVAKHRKHCRTAPVTELWCSSIAKDSDPGGFYSSAQKFSGSLIQRSLSPYKPYRFKLFILMSYLSLPPCSSQSPRAPALLHTGSCSSQCSGCSLGLKCSSPDVHMAHSFIPFKAGSGVAFSDTNLTTLGKLILKILRFPVHYQVS